jgi:hypothetical protein
MVWRAPIHHSGLLITEDLKENQLDEGLPRQGRVLEDKREGILSQIVRRTSDKGKKKTVS